MGERCLHHTLKRKHIFTGMKESVERNFVLFDTADSFKSFSFVATFKKRRTKREIKMTIYSDCMEDISKMKVINSRLYGCLFDWTCYYTCVFDFKELWGGGGGCTSGSFTKRYMVQVRFGQSG